MAYINDAAFDAGLAWVITNGTALSLCSQEPTSYAQVATYGLAKDTTVTPAAASDGASSGRRTIVPATDCVATASGTATHWALHNNSSILVATGAMSPSLAITNGVTYTGTTASITFPDAS